MKLLIYARLLRPTQWLKNLMLFFPPFLGGAINRPGLAANAVFPFMAFCLISSSGYLLNDLFDAENDRNHPTKKLRPLASGTANMTTAWMIAVCLLIAGLAAASTVSMMFVVIIIAYIAVSTCYSLKLKHVPLIDIFCISAGFLLRLQGGAEAFGIVVSDWLFLSVFLLSLFLSTGKRLCDKKLLGSQAVLHRKSLAGYPDGFLEGMMYLTGAVVLVTYTMYVISRHSLIYTVPLCTFGLLRYIFRVKTGLGGDPTDSLLRDLPLLFTSLVWTGLVGWSIYG